MKIFRFMLVISEQSVVYFLNKRNDTVDEIQSWQNLYFQGIGIALMIAQGLYGLYNIAAVSWLFVFFKDSFITAFDKYKWSMCFSGLKYE